jgi:demethylmenaquinone methyltransferase/2-methoxy-6-polyprenyl-1,4-benzoquinol methylase
MRVCRQREYVTTGFLQGVFAELPATYELVNHVLTLGLDTVWRKQAARTAAAGGGSQWADMCTGTGEMAAYLRAYAPEGTAIYAVDFSPTMMSEARRKPEAEHTRFVVSDVKALPFADQSLDLITVSFATRNLDLSRDLLIATFAEFRRVLRPGGRFINLETSQPSSLVIRRCFHTYVRLTVRSIGSRVSGSKAGYAYLAHTMLCFYTARELAGIMRQAGFRDVTFRALLFGVAAIHHGVRA